MYQLNFKKCYIFVRYDLILNNEGYFCSFIEFRYNECIFTHFQRSQKIVKRHIQSHEDKNNNKISVSYFFTSKREKIQTFKKTLK